jgi:predicted O-methyltransferase YrrM
MMQAMADIVSETHGDVVEVGFGMGISATMIQENGVRSHTIIEFNDDVIGAFESWRSQYPQADIRLLRGKWQDVVGQLDTCDGVFFDAYSSDEQEYLDEVLNSITFAEAFFPSAAAMLRPGGVFTYYTNEIDSFSRRHQRLIFEHFRSFNLSVVRSMVPPDDCNYWWADSMAVVKAIK